MRSLHKSRAVSILLSVALSAAYIAAPTLAANARPELYTQAAYIAKTSAGAVQSASTAGTQKEAQPRETAAAPIAFSESTQAAAKDPVIYQGAKSEIDATYKDDAYIRVRFTAESDRKLRVRVSFVDAAGVTTSYDYPIFNDKKWQTLGLQLGNGVYTIKVLENKSGNTYSVIQSQDISVTYSREHAPFLIPVQNINYSDTSVAVAKAKSLTQGLTEDLKKVEAVYKYIVETVKYDYDKANAVKAGQIVAPYIPDVDATYNGSKGICYDYSSLLAAMLRSIGIPTKLATGTVTGGGTHAWNEVYIAGTGWITVQSQIYFDGTSYSRMDSTFASSNTNGAYNDYIGDGSNYITKYIY